MESYEKKYKDALGWMQSVYPTMTGADKEDAEHFFPELKESEDEKIRKELIQFIKNWKDPNNIGRPHDFPTLTRNVEQCDRYIAWLEKQKEFISADFDDVWETADCDELTAPLDKYSKDAIKKMCHAWYDKGIELERRNWLEKQGEQIRANSAKTCKDEQKPANKVEPKFQNGQWIVWQNKCYKVNYNGCGYELIDQNGLRTSLEYGTVDTSSRLWDITIDAKDGDVLLASDGSIFIFKEVVDLGCKHYIALEEEDGTIQVNDNFAHCWETVTGVCPATKEQRDTLMKAMVDAGYTFDFDKKILNKIEQKPAWSEEDEAHIDSLLKRLEGINKPGAAFISTIFAISEDGDWLKSLKDRVGCEANCTTTWKPSKAQLEALEHSLGDYNITVFEERHKTLTSLYQDLKKLRDVGVMKVK